jgi:hypothetical protein
MTTKTTKENKRQQTGNQHDEYFFDAVTKPDGSTSIHRWLKTNLGFMKWWATSDGKYTAQQHLPDGTINHVVEGPHQFTADTVTNSVRGNIDSTHAGSGRKVYSKGDHSESGESSTKAVQGSSISSSKEPLTNMSQGHGHHYMQGDQTFHVENGGIHHEVNQDYTVTSVSGAITLHSGTETTIHSEKSLLETVGDSRTANVKTFSNTKVGTTTTYYSGQDITIESGTKITLKVGSSTIVIDNGSITLTSGAINMNKA